MALIVEDGTIVAGAESYLSVADADTIIADRGGDTAWDGLTEVQKEVQLRLATEYIDGTYCFIGCLVEATQPLMWPRAGLTRYDSDEIPVELKKALATLAKDTINTELYVNTEIQNGPIKSTSEKLDVLEVKTEYYSGGSSSGQPVFAEVNKIISPIVTKAGLGRS